MDYVVAEYFIEALGKSQTFCISYDFVQCLIDKAPQDITSYLKKDFLFILKKFPDVFILSGQSIALTDAFLSLYAFPDSSDFSLSHECSSIFEVDMIEYFKLILCRCISCHYAVLFDALLSQKNSQLSSFFSHYTLRDKYTFFQRHSNTFNVSNHNVFLKVKAFTKNRECIGEDKIYKKHLKKLTKLTNFLLTCFESLHYIEVKQCISFVLSNVKEFLNQHSLIKQREIFNNMSEITMDKFGYIFLTNFNVKAIKSRKVQLIISIVCILAFEREVHFEKLVQEVKRRCNEEISSPLCELSISEQLKFFKCYSEYFVVQSNSYINLLPSFVFPLCSFENTSLYTQTSQNLMTLNISNDVPKGQNIPVLKCPIPEITSPYVNFSNKMQQQVLYHGSNTVANCLFGGISALNVKVELSIIYLKTMFDFTVCRDILKSLLHILDDVRVCFFSLPQADQDNFIKDCCHVYNSAINLQSASNLLSMPCVNNNEKTLMFITYLLLSYNRMHFQKISGIILSKNVNSMFTFLDISGQFYYFKRMEKYFTVEINGFITLNQSFLLISSVMDAHFCSLSTTQTYPANINPINNEPENTIKGCLSESSTNTAHILAVDVNASTEIKEEINMPSEICDKLHFAVPFLQNCFHPLIAKHILQSFLHGVDSVNTYFSGLTTNDQHRFIAKYFQFISSENVIEIPPLSSDSNTQSLTQEEECLLFITYLLIIKKTSLHYRSIVKEMKKYQLMPQLLTTSDSNSFKYFRNLSKYFVITGDGFVCLSSPFSSLSSIISSVSACSQEIQKKMNKHITKFESLTNYEINYREIVNKCQNIVISVDSTKEKPERNISIKEETAALNMEPFSASDIIIDVCISILSVSGKMQIEKLCSHLKSFDISSIRYYFCFHSVSEKLHFFKNLSQYFDVTKDRFVSVREHILQSYVPKTNYIEQDSNGRFVTCNDTVSQILNKAESLKTRDSSDISDSSSNLESASLDGLKKARHKRGVGRDSKKKQVIERQIKVNPLAISKVNNILCSNINEDINGKGQKILSVNKTLSSLPQNQSINTENGESNPFRISTQVEQIHHKDEGNQLSSDSASSCFDSQFSIGSNSITKTEKNMDYSKSITGKYIFKNVWKTYSIDFNQLSCSKKPLLKNIEDLTETEVHSSEKFSRGDVPQNQNLKKINEPCNENLRKFGALHTDLLTNNNIQYKENFIKCNAKYNENVIKSDVLLSCHSPQSPIKIIDVSKNSLTNVPKVNDLEYDSYKSYGAELLNSFLSQLDTDNNLSNNIQNCSDIKSINKVATKQYNSGNMEKMPKLQDSKSCLTSDLVEFRAVNFFCVILLMYDNGLTAEFLMKHLNLASLEVQRFMLCHYEDKALSLFVKHKKDFYVSPQTNRVYLIK